MTGHISGPGVVEGSMEDVKGIEAVVRRRTFPPFIHDVRVRLGEYDGDPAAMVTLVADTATGMDIPAQMAYGEALSQFTHEVFVDLMEHSIGPFPYFRFEDADTGT